MACARELGLDEAKLNVNGGAIAIGHPLGATGVRLAITLARELKRSGTALRHRLGLHRRRPGHRHGDREHGPAGTSRVSSGYFVSPGGMQYGPDESLFWLGILRWTSRDTPQSSPAALRASVPQPPRCWRRPAPRSPASTSTSTARARSRARSAASRSTATSPAPTRPRRRSPRRAPSTAWRAFSSTAPASDRPSASSAATGRCRSTTSRASSTST